MKRWQRISWNSVALHAALGVLVLLTLLPLAIMLAISSKDLGQLTLRFWHWPDPIRWENYLFGVRVTARYLFNSLAVSGAIAALTLLCAALAAFALSRLRFPLRTAVRQSLLATMMVPAVLTFVPVFLLCRALGLLDSFWGLVLPQVAGALPMAILLLQTFFDDLPGDLFDSARIDGAHDGQVIWHIVRPLSTPVFCTVAIINLLATWNNYIWPLIAVQRESLRTLPLGLAFLTAEHNLQFEPGKVMAAYAVATVPLVAFFLIATKPFVQGLTSGAIKE